MANDIYSDDAWMDQLAGGRAALKATLALSKMIWTAMGFSMVLLVVISFAGGGESLQLGRAFDVQEYMNQGGIFLVAPLLGAFAAVGAFQIRKVMGNLFRRNFELRKSTEKNLVAAPGSFLPAVVVSLALAEAVVILGFLLVQISRQPAFVIPFAAAGFVVWMRVYPQKRDLRLFLFGE